MTIPRTSADEYGTAAIRRRVLASWAASPARFREDANAEEDASLGAYRDRLVVELLQNAVDAATEAGVSARVLVRLRTDDDDAGLLEIANTGSPLTAAGVEALSTLRASAKRDAAAVGRFGAGFAAVLAVSDTPSIASRSDAGVHGVVWSRAGAIEAIAALGAAGDGHPPASSPTEGGARPGAPGLAEELARRDGAVPILRLPFELTSPPPPPDGYDTVVRLPLRDDAAQQTARDLIATLDRTLPLVLGGPAELVIDLDGSVRTLTCRWRSGGPSGVEVADLDGERWRGIVRQGSIPAALLADRPVEERGRTRFTARVMVRDGGWPDDVAQVVRAPQPTDEPLSLPILASIELPLDPSRRHTIGGPLRDWLTAELAESAVTLACYLGTGAIPADDPPTPTPASEPEPEPVGPDDSAADRPPDPLAALALIPTGLPLGEVDGRLRDALARLLPDAPMLPGGRRGRDCSVCDLGPATDAVTELLLSAWGESAPEDGPATEPAAEPASAPEPEMAVPGLLPAGYAARRWRSALAAVGVRRLDSAALVELLTGVSRSPAWWGRLYAVLIAAPDRDALGALPVPIAEVAPAWAEDAAGPAGLRTRMVTGPRGTLFPTDGLDVVALARSGLPLRVVHPDACAGGAREALRTLGALEGTPAGVLRDPAVREAVLDADPDDVPDDLAALADAVLALVRDAGDESSAELGWLGDLLLPAGDGTFEPAGELLIGGGPLDRVLAEDAPFGTLDPEVTRSWPAEVLAKLGVLSTFGVLRADDLPLDADEQILLELDDSDTWVDDVAADERGGLGHSPNLRRPPAGGPPAPSMVRAFVAVRDLELVDARAWPEALVELSRPPLRDIVFAPEPSYTRWWLARHAVLPVDPVFRGTPSAVAPAPQVALPPGELLLPGADPLLSGLFSPAAVLPGVDTEFLRHLGCRLTLEDVLGDLPAVMDLLDRLGDADREVDWPAARILYIAAVDAVARVAARPEGDAGDVRFDPPLTVRTPAGVVPATEAVVVDAPDMLGLVGAHRSALRLPLDRAAEVAAVLGVPLASDLGDGELAEQAEPAGAAGPAAAGQDRRAPDGTPYREHPALLVENLDGEPTRVPWRVLGGIGGEIHTDAEAGPDALARALAWHGGQWDRRHALAAALRDPDGAAIRAAEDDLDEN